ncbi:MAG TPA: glycine zipper 2TM domain-containing protein [Desulfuromonadales bacterium]|nr:glycine zipper 2TM domain-containing protein [Desulfuromonadales bacterium]
MDSSIIRSITIGSISLVALAVASVGGCTEMSQPKFADVVAVKEITETITTPREECRDVQVQTKAPVKDSNRIAGTVIGGVVGAVLGNQIGGGRGKTVATIAGGAGGAYAGNKVQDGLQESDVVTTTRRDCKTVYDKAKKVVGYDVTYRLKDKEGVVRTSFRPGSTLPVENGMVVVTPPVAAQ